MHCFFINTWALCGDHFPGSHSSHQTVKVFPLACKSRLCTERRLGQFPPKIFLLILLFSQYPGDWWLPWDVIPEESHVFGIFGFDTTVFWVSILCCSEIHIPRWYECFTVHIHVSSSLLLFGLIYLSTVYLISSRLVFISFWKDRRRHADLNTHTQLVATRKYLHITVTPCDNMNTVLFPSFLTKTHRSRKSGKWWERQNGEEDPLWEKRGQSSHDKRGYFSSVAPTSVFV